MKRHSFPRPWWSVALLLVAGLPAVGADKPASRVPVYCPAIPAEDRSRTNAFTDGELPSPTLVVLGTARWLKEERVEIEVEKALYGSAPTRKIRAIESFNHHGDRDRRRRIFVLAPTDYAWVDVDRARWPWELLHSLPAEEEKAVAVVSAARLDYNTLSAEVIFVGKELSAEVDKERTVEVVRVLHGDTALKGKKVCVYLTKYGVRDDSKPHIAKEEMLYFVAAVEPAQGKLYLRSVPKADGPVYVTSHRLPADQEKNVLAALGRRDQYPIVEIQDGDKKVKVREVMFRGSAAEAIELLGSRSEGAAVLAGQFLIHNPTAARKPLLEAVEKDLLRMERKDGFQRLHHLISLLPRVLSPQSRQEDLEGLVEKWLTHLAKNPPAPPTPKGAPDVIPWPTYFYREEENTYFNHSLSWLLDLMPEERVVRLYSKRLLQLRDKVPAGWKREVQLALDVTNVEDHLELADAVPRLKDVRPVRSKAALRHPGGGNEGVLAFSPDGKYLATIGGGDLRVWHTHDWSAASKPIPQDGSIHQLRFSPDGRFLYVIGGGGGLQIHARFDWRAGKLDRAYEGHKSGVKHMDLSTDGKVMVTSNYYEDIFLVHETETGKVLKTFKAGDVAVEFALSPDGKTLIRQKTFGEDEKPEWTVEALGTGALKVPAAVFRAQPYRLRFTADGRYLLGLVERRKKDERETRLHVWDVKDGFRETVSGPVGERVDRVDMASRGQLVVTVTDRRKEVLLDADAWKVEAQVMSLPGLKPLKKFTLPERERETEIRSIRFSPDGKLLALGLWHRPTPYLFRTDTWEPVVPFEGHAERITGVFFPPDGKVVRTLGADNTICTWDARTLKLLRRQSLPAGWKPESVREPDGRYLIGTTADDKKERTLAVFDVEADKVVATVKVQSEYSSPLSIFWATDHEIYALDKRGLCHFDVTNGKVLARRKFETWLGRGAQLSEDGKEFLLLGGDVESPVVDFKRISVQTGKAARVGEVRLRRFFGSKRGVVPGGKYFYVADPGFYLFDSKSMKLVTSRAFRGTDALNVAFTRKGSRFAVVVGGRIHIDFSVREGLRQWDPGTKTVVRIHDTKTGRTLGAFPASTRWVSVKFSPDGKQLAVINDDGTFELWDLSPLNRS
jgi:WD40 repeat protein